MGVFVYTVRVLWVGSHETIDAGPYTPTVVTPCAGWLAGPEHLDHTQVVWKGGCGQADGVAHFQLCSWGRIPDNFNQYCITIVTIFVLGQLKGVRSNRDCLLLPGLTMFSKLNQGEGGCSGSSLHPCIFPELGRIMNNFESYSLFVQKNSTAKRTSNSTKGNQMLFLSEIELLAWMSSIVLHAKMCSSDIEFFYKGLNGYLFFVLEVKKLVKFHYLQPENS